MSQGWEGLKLLAWGSSMLQRHRSPTVHRGPGGGTWWGRGGGGGKASSQAPAHNDRCVCHICLISNQRADANCETWCLWTRDLFQSESSVPSAWWPTGSHSEGRGLLVVTEIPDLGDGAVVALVRVQGPVLFPFLPFHFISAL